MQRPLGVTIIAILLAIGAVINIIVGLEAAEVTSFGLGAAAGSATQGYGYIVAGVLTLIASYGLFALKGWAWMLAIIVLIIRIVVDGWAILVHGAGSVIGGAAIGQIVINAIFLWYFMRGNVKAAFGR